MQREYDLLILNKRPRRTGLAAIPLTENIMDDFDDIQCEDYYDDTYWNDGIEDPEYLVDN